MKLVAWTFFVWSVLYIATFYFVTGTVNTLLDCWKGCGQ